MKTRKTTMALAAFSAITAFMLVGCGGGGGGSDTPQNDTPQPEYHPYDAPPISESLKASYLNAVNAARAQGRECHYYDGSIVYMPPAPPLEWSDGLYRAAYEHTQDMDSVDIMQHEGSGTASDWTAQVLSLGRGSTTAERQMNNGAVPEPYYLNENVARMGKTNTLNGVINGWLSSKDGHCVTMMDASLKYYGMAHVGIYWTQEFSVEKK
ncbi:putative membrane protein [hydrothermal vent metagenome]|uniref:Putative membrane protein n=1 Tax=hydrothermal vent metagenome TaxID=652676 RepID=A0A1W1E9T5_9ZZZZ